MMPFKKQGPNDYTGPSGKHFNYAQVQRYYARGGHFANGGLVMSKQMSSGAGDYAKGGPVLGRSEDWMKSPDRFRSSGGKNPDLAHRAEPTEDQYPKTGTYGKLAKPTGDKSLPCRKPRT
jgi:hypothetical protein